MTTFYLFSVRPEYAQVIFEGRKKFELRRGKGAGLEPGGIAIIYVSGKVKEIRGEFTIGKIRTGLPEEIWRYVRRKNPEGISPESMMFIRGSKVAAAIEIRDPRLYKVFISLREIRRVYPKWNPPMGYQRLNQGDGVLQKFILPIRRLSIEAGRENEEHFLP
ncbi:MAG: DNA-binding protein [Thermoprotei archaeon]|nr:DNA-binding protein [Thermoprotei archaeon]